MEFVNLPQLKSHLMKDAAFGTGKTENALLAQITGSSTFKENVSPFQINARPSTHQVLVSLATRDTTLKMEPASSPLLKDQVMLDVVFGIGTREFV